MVEQSKVSRRHFLIESGSFLAGTLAASCCRPKLEGAQNRETLVPEEQVEETVQRTAVVKEQDIRMGIVKELRIAVRDVAGLDTLRPLTGGVPIARGAAPEGSGSVLRDDGGRTVPLQTSVLARWQDGSARWVLLDFQAQPPARGMLGYSLLAGEGLSAEEARRTDSRRVVCQSTKEGPVLASAGVRVSLTDGA